MNLVNTYLPTISIIIVTFNAGQTLENTLLSVIEQTYKNIELIIIDGGSKDNTLDIIKRYSSNISYWISEPDKGIYDAMNKGAKVAKGDFFYFLGADDLLYNRKVIEVISPFLVQNNCIYYGDVIFTPINKKYCGEFNRFKLSISNICHQSIFYPQKVFQNYEYEIKYRIYADYIMNINLFSDKSFRFEYINTVIANFNINGASSKIKDYQFEKEISSILKNKLGYKCLTYYKLRAYFHRIKLLMKFNN